MKRILFIFSALFLFSLPALAQQDSATGMSLVERGTVREILQPDLILLENDKRYRIDNLRVPPEYREQATAFLEKNLSGRDVSVYVAGAAPVNDRYGLPLVQVMRDDGLWVQGAMILNGLAWFDVSPASSSGKVVATLQGMEQDARQAGTGFWANATHAVKTPDGVGQYINTFQVVEGKVLSVTRVGNYVYLNFGADYKTDFTISVPTSVWRRFGGGNAGARLDTASWHNKVVRIRGWVVEQNGPMIEMTDISQIEFPDVADTQAVKGAQE